MFGSGNRGQQPTSGGQDSLDQGGNGSGGGGGGGFGQKSSTTSPPVSSSAAFATPSFFGGTSGFGSGAGGSSGNPSFASPVLPTASGSGIFGSKTGFGSSTSDTAATRAAFVSTRASFGGGTADGGGAIASLGTGFGTGRGFGGRGRSGAGGSTAGFGGPPSAETNAASSAPSWLTVAATKTSGATFGTGGGFGSRGGFGGATTAGVQPSATSRADKGILVGSGKPTLNPTVIVTGGSGGGDGGGRSVPSKSTFGTGGFGGGGFGSAGPSIKNSTYVPGARKKESQASAGSYSFQRGGRGTGDGLGSSRSTGFAGTIAGGSGGSFADAAKRGALSSVGWGSGGISGGVSVTPSGIGSTNTSFGDVTAGKARPPRAFGTKTGSATSSIPASGTVRDSADTASSRIGEGRTRSDAASFDVVQTPASRGQPDLGTSLSWGGGLLRAGGKASTTKTTKRESAKSDGTRDAADNEAQQNAPPARSKRKNTSGVNVPVMGKSSSASTAESSRIIGGFGALPPADYSDPPAFVGGGEGGGKSKSKASRVSSPRENGIIGGFGAPPQGSSSDSPAFVGGAGGGRREGGVGNGMTSRSAPLWRSKIMGGFGASPPGFFSGPPTFVGGGGDEGGGGRENGRPKTSRTASPRGSKIMGGFGSPPRGASSDPPRFVGGGRGGDGGVRASAPDQDIANEAAAKTRKARRSKVMGGFGDPPGGASSDPPSFVGGGGGGGGEGTSSSGQDIADKVAAKARKTQRFGGASRAGGGGVGGSSGRTRGGDSSTGVGAGDSGGGSAEDVQRGSHLDDAEIKLGTVEAMCPLEEKSRRVPGDLHILEKEHPSLFMPNEGDGAPPRLWLAEDLVVKRHQRAAAGMDISKPELLRTPTWLARTVDHLIWHCVDKGPHGGGESLAAWDDPRIQEYMAKFRTNNPSRADFAEEETEHDLYNFVWDRFRMIRSDYNMQGYNPVVGLVSEASVVAHERMARWYVLMANRMEKNTMQTHRFNLKSIVETLKKLYEFYTIRVARGEINGGLASPNEPEIMAYYLLTVLEQDDGVEVQRLVKDLIRSRREKVLESPEIKGVLRVVRAWHAGDYVAFFWALRGQGVMHRCLLAQYVKSMRNTAINVIATSFADISVPELMRLLCFQTEDEAVTFLIAYNLKVSRTGQILLREKDRNHKWSIPFRRPESVPDSPPLQDLVEPKPWRKASEWVLKGDYEPSAEKSHDVGGDTSFPAAGANGSRAPTALTRATSSSSSYSASPVGRGLRAKVAGRAMPGALPSRPPVDSRATRQSSRTTTTTTGHSETSSKKAPVLRQAGSFESRTATPGETFMAGGDLVGALHHPVSISKLPGSAASACAVGGSGSATLTTPVFAKKHSSNLVEANGGVVVPNVNIGPTSASAQSDATQQRNAEGAASLKSNGTLVLSDDKLSSLAAPSPGQTANLPPPVTALVAPVASVNNNPHPIVPLAEMGNSVSSLPMGSTATTAGPAPPVAFVQTSSVSLINAAAASAAASLARAQQAARRQEEANAEAKKRQMEQQAASSRRAAAVAKENKRKLEREAEGRTAHALSVGKLVPVDVFNKLPLNSNLRCLALDHRKKLALRLASFGPAVVRRKQTSAWNCWLEETNRWVEEQYLVKLRNRRCEEHSALVEHALFLRRNKKRRSQSDSTWRDRADHLSRMSAAGGRDESHALPQAAATAAMLAAAAKRNATGFKVLCKPKPLNLTDIVAPGLVKNQGTDAEEAFREVGLTAVKRLAEEPPGKIAGGSVLSATENSLSPPHLFWKAVVVTPARTRGSVGAWLEAKLGGDVRRMSEYRQDLCFHRACPELQEGEVLDADDDEEVACGSSGHSKLILRALRKLPNGSSTGQKPGGTRPQWMHLCVQRISIKEGLPLKPSPHLSEKLKAASVVVFAATPRDDDRFFWSPLHPKPDWSRAREDLQQTLESASSRGGCKNDADLEFWGVPVLVVIPIKDSILQRGGYSGNPVTSHHLRKKILEDVWEGLELKRVAEKGFSFRVVLVGLHEFESRSKAAAATGGGLVFCGGLEDANSKDLAAKLAELAEQAPRQPLIATRSLQEMLSVAVSRATTDDRYADAAGLALPRSPYESPPLGAVVGAATRATQHVYGLLARRCSTWPIAEFSIPMKPRGQSSSTDEEQRMEVTFVPGAARPAGGEISGSPLFTLESADDGASDARASLRSLIEASGGLPLDWETALLSPKSLENLQTAGDSAAAYFLLRAATLPTVTPELATTFSPNALAGGESSRPLGPKGAWAKVEQLEAYLGKGLIPEDLRSRLAEALASGTMMRGPPPPWRTLVRDAVAKRVALAQRGGVRGRPLVVHFVAAFGQERLNTRESCVVTPSLLEAKKFRTPSSKSTAATSSTREKRVLTPTRDPAGNQGDIVAQVSAALKRAAPLMADAKPTKHSSKHRRTSSCSTLSERRTGGDPVRRRFFGNGNATVVLGNFSDLENVNDSCLLEAKVDRVALETENVKMSRERAASFAAADHRLDEAFLASFGASLITPGSSGGDTQLPSAATVSTEAGAMSFDIGRVTSLPLPLTEAKEEDSKAEQQEKDARRRRAATSLTAVEYECWLIREEIKESRRQEEKISSEIFNGDPLLPLASRVQGSEFEV